MMFFEYCIYQQCISIEYAPQPQVEYIQQASGTSSGIMFSTDIPDCGLLQDKLSLMWGDYKDKIDELTMEVNKKRLIHRRTRDYIEGPDQDPRELQSQVFNALVR